MKVGPVIILDGPIRGYVCPAHEWEKTKEAYGYRELGIDGCPIRIATKTIPVSVNPDQFVINDLAEIVLGLWDVAKQQLLEASERLRSAVPPDTETDPKTPD